MGITGSESVPLSLELELSLASRDEMEIGTGVDLKRGDELSL